VNKLCSSGFHSTFLSSLNLCKETCQELRILIDFLLPIVLLYDSEQQQYKELIQNAKIYKIEDFARFVIMNFFADQVICLICLVVYFTTFSS